MTNKLGSWILSGFLSSGSPTEPEPRIDSVQRPGRAWTMILLDVSGSMFGQKIIEARKAVVAYGVDASELGESVGLMTFSDTTALIAVPSADISGLCSELQGLSAGGGTDLVPALEGTEVLGRGVRGVRKVVVVTDGMTSRPDEAVAIAARMREDGCFFVTRGIPEADEEFLKKLRGPEGRGTQTPVSGLVGAMQEAALLLPAPRNGGSLGTGKA